MNTLQRINAPNYLLLKSIKELGLKVEDFSIIVQSDLYHVYYDDKYKTVDAKDLYHLYVDGKIDHDNMIRNMDDKTQVSLGHDKTLAEMFRRIRNHLDRDYYIRDVKKKRYVKKSDVKKRVSFNLENNVFISFLKMLMMFFMILRRICPQMLLRGSQVVQKMKM